MREALRTSREAEAQREALQAQLGQQGEALAAAEAAAMSAQAAAAGAREEAQQQLAADLEAVKQERGGCGGRDPWCSVFCCGTVRAACCGTAPDTLRCVMSTGTLDECGVLRLATLPHSLPACRPACLALGVRR